MSYKICYFPENSRRYPKVSSVRRLNWSKYIAVLLLFGFGVWVKFQGVPDFLIPGDPEITKQAAEMMITELRNGEPVDDAVLAFCQEILDSAES